MSKEEVNKIIQDMIKNPDIKSDEVFRFVKGECQTIVLTPQTLGMLFEIYAGIEFDENDDMACFTKEIPISELKNIHPGFESTNGCQWARSDNSYLGKKYIIKRPKKGGKVFAIQLDGPNKNSVKNIGESGKIFRMKFVLNDVLFLILVQTLKLTIKMENMMNYQILN